MRTTKTFIAFLTIAFLLYSCGNTKTPTNASEVRPQFSGVEEIHLNIDPRKDEYQFIHLENIVEHPFVILGKVKAESIGDNQCSLKSMTLTAQAVDGDINYFYIKRIKRIAEKGNSYTFEVCVDVIPETGNVTMANAKCNTPGNCGKDKLCLYEHCFENTIKVDHKTVFNYKIITTKSLDQFVRSTIKTNSTLGWEDIKFCCGAICKTTFSF